MKNLRIYIQRPWRFADSPYYKYLLDNPPKNIKYIGQNQKIGAIEEPFKFLILHKIKGIIRRVLRIINLPIPNVHKSKSPEKFDLIHCAHCLSLNNEPWVVDAEWVGQFWISGNFENHPNKYFVKKILKGKNCKKILAWTNWARDGIIKEFPEIKNKVEVVYPGIPFKKFEKIKSDKIRLVFSSRRFYFKGGLYALEIMDKLTKKYDNVEGLIISEVPNELIRRYSKNPKIKIMGVVSQKKLFEKVYPSTDIFLYPSFTDTFGFQITEAMAFGIPVVSSSGHSRREIIRNGKTGYIVETGFGDNPPKNFLKNLKGYEDIIEKFCEKTSEIIENKSLRVEMSKNSLNEIKNGKFAMGKMQKKLTKIYREAIR